VTGVFIGLSTKRTVINVVGTRKVIAKYMTMDGGLCSNDAPPPDAELLGC